MKYEPSRPAAFFDEYGEREWSRFEDGRASPVSLEVHKHYLRRFVRSGKRVLDVGAGPGRFTIELAKIGARIGVADISKVQLELNREKVEQAGFADAVLDRVVADVTDLSAFADGEFDAAVCYGGPLMSLVGAFSEELRAVLTLPLDVNERIVTTGCLDVEGRDHVEMRLFRWPELEELFVERGCTIVAASASNMNTAVEHELYPTLDGDTRDALVRWEIDLGAEPGAVSRGTHIIVVARRGT